ncbi:acetyltransferase [Vitiosangium sp. GDMCC 1.1324]|uniref:acetyltransferase n=1 Tax=Vitiosangium sp. (strain GDMCC 1.1324) TaxID=2138576 RepID=UPI000D3BC890|nr:acetyltransferase [Vitiosangium sp. GDMCC 1.1324]PTL80104.1 acetyltransferase [Vitiosangium sp. GDMCC 1.1324]
MSTYNQGERVSRISEVTEHDFDELINVWEASVRATHDFLPAADIDWLRPKIRNEYFGMVNLRAYRDEADKILGFVGVAGGNVEMLFIAPATRGQGIGKQLLQHAIEHLGATTVDVNEQNPQAVGFYLHEGFETTGRSELDGQGKPYPLLHMKLKSAA